MKTQLKSMLITAIGGASLLGPVVNVSAEDTYKDRSLTLGPRAEYFKPQDGDGVWSGGAQLRVYLSQSFALEGAADYRRQKVNGTRIETIPVQASILAYLVHPKPVGLYLLGGVGWYFTHIDPPDPAPNKTDDRLGLHAGAGVEFRLAEHWSIDGSYRYIWLESIKTKDAQLQDREISDRGQMVTIGLNYNF